jgi:hypothetical protein
MLNSIFSFSNLFGVYSGSPFLASLGSVTYNYGPMSQGANLAFLSVFMLIGLALLVFMIVAMWKVFEKAGRPGWAAIIPIYNGVVLLKIVGMSPWFILLAFIPFFGSLIFFIVSIFMNIRLARAFGKSNGFAVGLIFLSVVFIPILAFGKAKFNGVAPVSPVVPSSPVPPQNPSVPPASPTNPV